MLSIFKDFLPWILYSSFYGNSRTQFMFAAGVALFSSLLVDKKNLRDKFILSWGTVIYFGLLLLIGAFFHWTWLQNNTWLISNLVLAGIAFASSITGKPFTIQYAKRTTPEIYWRNALFLQINHILTNIWGVIFFLTAVANFFYTDDPKINYFTYLILSNIGWPIGAYISNRFPDFWKNRYFKSRKPKNLEKAKSPFLEGNFAPWRSEDHFDSLTVIGKIPLDLDGVLLRNGPNPQFDPLGHYHWFEGDGMLHAIRIHKGTASYDNRWIRTERFQLENTAGKPLIATDFSEFDENAGDLSGTANTNIIAYHKKLLALNEGASPVEVKLHTLETIGTYTFDGQISRRLTAHPRYDHRREEFITYSYIGEDERLFYYRLNKENKLIAEKEILWPYPAMMHDFANTENYVIFGVFPCTMSMERMMKGENMFIWEGDRLNTWFIITDRAGNEVTRIETKPYYVYHFANAYEQGDTIILDAVISNRSSLMPDRFGKQEEAIARPGRFTLHLKDKTVAIHYFDERTGEFPRFDERFNGHPYHYLYLCSEDKPDGKFDRITQYDLVEHTKSEHCFGNDVPSEPVFVPRSEKEGDGYLLTVVYRSEEDRSDVVILDTKDLSAEPVAVIQIPHRIPFGFHGNFV